MTSCCVFIDYRIFFLLKSAYLISHFRYCSQPDPATITTTTRRPVTAAFEPEEIIHCEGDHACTSVEKSCNSNSCSILCNGEYSCGYTRYLDVI